MKRNTAYSAVVFLLVISYVLFGTLTQLLMGEGKWGDLPLIFIAAAFAGAAVGAIFYFSFSKLTGILGSQEKTAAPFAPTRAFFAASVALIVTSGALGAKVFYSTYSEQRAETGRQKNLAEERKNLAAKTAEAERQRIASLTPEQRAAEDKQRNEKAETAKKVAAAGGNFLT